MAKKSEKPAEAPAVEDQEDQEDQEEPVPTVLDAPVEPSGEDKRIAEARAALAKRRDEVLRKYKGKVRGEVPKMAGTLVFVRSGAEDPPEKAVLVDYRPEA